MALVIREATAGDYEAICAIISEVDRLHREALPARFRPSAGPARSRDYIISAIVAPSVGLFVAEMEGQLVGLVHVVLRDVPAIPILVPRRYAVIDNLVVHGAHRRAGIGRALMNRAETWARSRGATSVELTVYAFNGAAREFYRSIGYDTLYHHMAKSLAETEPEGEGA